MRRILVHVLVGITVCLFATAGFWQLHRLSERRAHNAEFRARGAMPPLASIDDMSLRELQFRRARLSGRLDIDEQVVLTGRPSQGRQGNHLLAPLVFADGSAIIVDRGWVPTDTPLDDLPHPFGEMQVEGVLLPSESQVFDSGSRETDTLTRVLLDRLQAQMEPKLAPVYVLLAKQVPPQPDDLPVPGDLAPLTEGTHLSYAVQWFLFIPTLLGVYWALLRKRARSKAASLDSAT